MVLKIIVLTDRKTYTLKGLDSPDIDITFSLEFNFFRRCITSNHVIVFVARGLESYRVLQS